MFINLFSSEQEKIVPNHSFIVTIGPLVFSFMKISNITSSIDYDSVPEGGNNDYPNLFQKQKNNADTLILEKCVKSGPAEAAFSLLREGVQVEVVNVLVLKNDIPVKNFFFQKGIIIKREFSTLDATRSELFIQKIEIAHSGLVEIPLPSI